MLDENGKSQVVTMGSYGIGVSRVVAAIAEASHDEKGLIWPVNVAPFHVYVMATGKEAAVFDRAEALGRELEAAGFQVLYDDRPKASAGVKFKDAELLGMPYMLVEVRTRATGNSVQVPVEDAVSVLVQKLRQELERVDLQRSSTELLGQPDQFEVDQQS